MEATDASTDDAPPEITRTDEFALEEAVDSLTRINSARHVSGSDVWAVIHVDTDEFGDVLGKAVSNRDVVVRNADRSDGAISIALEKFDEYL